MQSANPAVKQAVAAHAESQIKVDGILDDRAWQEAPKISDFIQQEPHVNEPVSERTFVQILFDDEAIYFGITCSDSDPHGVIARELRRDNKLTDDDRFEIVLDTFHDHRNAFYFVINPLGTQYDALITDEGQDINSDWDERWWSPAQITETGWTAEIKIPFTTLRSRAGVDEWGVNFKRFIRRKNETAQWSGWDRAFNFTQVSQAGNLLGIESVHTGLRLRVKPYVLGGFKQSGPVGNAPFNQRSDAGLEVVKFSLTPGLTAELTGNTDFAQAEVDDAVVNLTRFPVFYPEKREFFLERAGIFEYALGVRRGATGAQERQLAMFFPRRIGLTEDRQPVPLRFGGKLIGRARGFDLGLLNAQTGEYRGRAGSNYTVFRLKRNILARSNIGTFISSRQSSSNNYNRVIGSDANFTLFKNTDIQGSIGKSFTPGKTGNDYVGRFKYNWLSEKYELFVDHLYVGDDFQNDIGYIRRKGIERTQSVGVWQPRPGIWNIRYFVIRADLTYTTDLRRRLLARDQFFQFSTRFQTDDAIRFNTTQTFDRLEEKFSPHRDVTIRPADYLFRQDYVEFESSPKRRLAGRTRYGWGGFYNGHIKYIQVSPTIKPRPQYSLETSYEFDHIELPQATFNTNVLNLRFNFNLTNRWLTSTISQYDSESKRQVFFFRLNYIYRPGDDFFIVFNQSKTLGSAAGRSIDRTLLLKWTYSFDF